MNRRDRFIWAIITVFIVWVFVNKYNAGKNDSIELTGNNNNYYYVLYNNNKFTTKNKLSDFQLVTYDKDSNKKKKYNLSNISNEIFCDMKEAQAYGDWILFKEITSRKIIGININKGTTEIIVDKTPKNEEIYTIKNLDFNANKLIYSYSYNFKTTIVVKDIETEEEYEIGTFDTIADIPVTIYKDKVAYILNNEINIYSLNDKKLIGVSDKLYNGDLLLYEDNIYTYKKGEYYENLVKLDLEFNEEVILEKVMGGYNLYYDNGRIIYDKYFYDTSDNKLYLTIIENSWSYSRLLLQDFIYSRESKYEKMKKDENYYEYPLKGELIRSTRKKINDNEEVAVLVGGEVAVVKANTNYIIRSYEGFNVDDRFLLWDLCYENNKVYNIAENIEGDLELLAIDINTGEKQLIKEVNESKDDIKHLSINNGELGYLVENGDKSKLVTYDINTCEEKSIVLSIAGDIQNLLFNERYIVLLPWDERNIYILSKNTGNILGKSEDKYFSLYDLNDKKILADNGGEYEVIEYNLKKLKVYDNYDKALKDFKK